MTLIVKATNPKVKIGTLVKINSNFYRINSCEMVDDTKAAVELTRVNVKSFREV